MFIADCAFIGLGFRTARCPNKLKLRQSPPDCKKQYLGVPHDITQVRLIPSFTNTKKNFTLWFLYCRLTYVKFVACVWMSVVHGPCFPLYKGTGAELLIQFLAMNPQGSPFSLSHSLLTRIHTV